MVETPTADSPAEPDISHVDPTAKSTWLGHPRQLARLFSIEMWERFGFYGMRALLVLYLTKHFLLADHEASGIVGGFLSLVYLTPLVGGWLADRYLGSKRSVKFGALVMALGYFLLCFGGQQGTPYATINGQRYNVTQAAPATPLAINTAPQTINMNGKVLTIHGMPDGSVQLLGDGGAVVNTVPAQAFSSGADRQPFYTTMLLVALSLIVIGNGFFKPNISTIVGSLYGPGDRRRDAGFTIFYAGINLGSILGQAACPWLVNHFGWWAGFLIVSFVLLIAYVLMQFDGGRLSGYGEPPTQTGRDRAPLIYLLSFVSVIVFWLVFQNVMTTPEAKPGAGVIGYLIATPFLGKVLLGIFLAAVIGIPIWSWRVGEKVEREMMLAAIILVVFNVTFWALFEQAASSLTLFADRNTTLEIFGFHMSAAATQQFNPIVVVLFAPVMSWLWLSLAKRGLEPSIQVKFAIALMLVGLGFVVLALCGSTANEAFRVSLWWLVLTYFLHSIAELCISPVGLSMITKLSIARIVGMMMGVWFLSISVGEYLAGAAAQSAAVKTVGGQVTNPELALHTYLHTFMTGGELTIGAGVVLLVISPLLKRLMHGVT
ncbi:peptide MFS transporter [Sphingomonas sp.]|jgi:POT family proton-dependent oligopeptide transporter|uniref:peptide MFS transporter n=1 Tax=Sphingomonas sp. TaxID=28214 RepID=UPI002E3001E9|nr:peptide MFS transporter [Sphingomonas sp.]HEX4694301.1 peptide MFS transporter [Sphingomonas sp.]